VDDFHLFKDGSTIVGDQYFAFGILDLQDLILEGKFLDLPFYPYHGDQVKF
jgi:hypothetical protein